MNLANKKKATGSSFKFNPFDSKFRIDPYPSYHRLRSEEPVHWSFLNAWVLTGYAEVKTVLGDRKRFVAYPKLDYIQSKSHLVKDEENNLDALAGVIRKWFLFMNPPEHTALRQMVDRTFLMKKVEEMRPFIQQLVDEAIARHRHEGKMDIMTDLAMLLPVAVISKILGLPAEYSRELKHWGNELFLVLEPVMSLSDYQRLDRVAVEFREFLREAIAEKLKHPQEDLTSSAMANLLDGDSQLSPEAEEKLISLCTGIFSAGEETTVNLIGSGMLALLRDRDSLKQLAAEPSIIDSALEELLRYDSPVQMLVRTAAENVEIGDKTIRAGDSLLLWVGAANRDPARFSEPDRLDLTRPDNAHFAFGDGIHQCIGSALARLQGRIAIATLVREFPDMQLDTDKLEWHKTVVVRGLKSLPVKFSS